MILTSVEKRKIEEEEELRAKIRSEFDDRYQKKKGMGCLKATGLLIGLLILGSFLAVWFSDPDIKSDTQKQEVSTKQGSFLDYKYEILSQEGNSKYTAHFTPFLPRNDGIVISAMIFLLNNTYEKHTLKNLQPGLVEKDGVNVFRFDAIDGYYYFTPIKEDTGEIYSFVFWKE